jgi:uncharacterized membrane-anchored protein
MAAGVAIHPPVHLVIHPDEPIRTVDDAVKVIERHARHPDSAETKALLLQLTRARSQREVEAAANRFRQWAEKEGLLMVPPEDA